MKYKKFVILTIFNFLSFFELLRHEWLFVCDNMDAIFRTDEPSGIVDMISASGIIPSTDYVSIKIPQSMFDCS